MSKKYTAGYFVRYIMLIIAAATAIGIVYHYAFRQVLPDCYVEGVVDYNPVQDKQQIIDLFNADHYWLTVNDDHDIEYTLDTHSPNRYESRYFGKMPIKVIRDNGVVAAWIMYYMRGMYEGKILFLDVHKDYRKKRYARRLMKFAECDLHRMGAYKVTLAARTSNHAAQIAYERMGYTKTDVTQGFFYYEKRLR